jgi:integrase
LRVPYQGERKYVRLGRDWTRDAAEKELRRVLVEIEQGTWTPPDAAPAPSAAPATTPTFAEYADQWYGLHEHEWRAKTRDDYRWALELHLVPALGHLRLSEITPKAIREYVAAKLAEGRLGANGVNKTLTRLAQILEDAVEDELLPSNPARNRRLRAKATRPKRQTLEPCQLPALLDAAGFRLRPVLAVLAGAGLRVGEAVALDWRDVNLARGTLTVQESKTDAGSGRVVDLPAGAVEELATWKAQAPATDPGDPVFTSEPRNGRAARQTKRNVEARLKKAIRDANVSLREAGIVEISERVTPHSFRRLFASLRFALGDNPVQVAAQIGHESPGFTMSVYASALTRRERQTPAELAEHSKALAWAAITAQQGTTADSVQSGAEAESLEMALPSH